jgi:hypothetical protein
MGLAVDDGRGIGPALERISADYERFSGASLDFFEQELDFSRAFAEVVRRVDALR